MNETYQKEERNCPICNHNEKQLLFQQSFSKISHCGLLDGYNVVACKKCGFCFADNIPNQKVFDKYYKDMSKYEKLDSSIKESQYDILKFQKTVEYLKSNTKNKDSYIVEIGCATGLLLSLLKNDGFSNLLGIDPSPACVEIVNKRYSIPSRSGTISDLSTIKPESVDLIILLGVLEHIKDLDLALNELSIVLKPEGKVCILIPDASQYFNGKDAPFQEFSVEHINFFGPLSLTNLMIKHKFSKISIEQQVFEDNYNTLTPVILSIFIKDKEGNASIIFDQETVDNLKKYITNCYIEEKSIYFKIEKIYLDYEPIVIWGTGAQTLRLLANSDLSKANIIAFVDSNPKYQGNKLNNISVIRPEELKDNQETILISTRAYQNEIEHQIKETLKLKNKIIKLY
jgi:ubiquinone/menaquinone biosynthesis C-methylase UbiE